MKANVSLEIEKDDLSYELQKLVSEIAGEEIRKMVKEEAAALVKEEVRRIIAPIVDSHLQQATIGREYQYHGGNIPRRNVDDFIKTALVRYLDEKVYVFSKTDNTMSGRYAKCSDQNYSGDKTRAEAWVIEKSRKYVDENLFTELEQMISETVKQIVPSKEQLQELIKNEVKAKFE